MALLVLTPSLEVRATNETFCKLFRTDATEMIGHRLFELHNRQWDIPEVRRQLGEILPEDEQVAGFEVDQEFPGIGHRTMLLHARRLDAVQLILLAIQDISGRKRAEGALRHSERRLAVALEAIGAGVYEHSVPVTDDLYHSERWAEILGYRKDELPPHDGFLDWLYERVHRDDLAALEEAYLDFIEGRVPQYRVEIRVRDKDGSWKWVSGFAEALERSSSGAVTRVAGVMLDITARKEAEEALRTSEERLRQFAENSADVLWIVDLDAGRLEYLSPAYERVWGNRGTP